ncbi:MAG: hypothetical protein IIC75_01355 [Bacteroidetes bacterium]|nr:hypothetical protein [Bacteroidota bacterium]
MIEHWNGIYGQTPAKKILTKIINSSNIPHAFLFTGKDGIGKEYTAIEFAKQINIKNLPSDKINKTSSSISNLLEPYIKYIFPLPRGKNETDKDGPFAKLDKDTLEEIKNNLKEKTINPYYSIQLPNTKNIKINSIRNIKKFISLDYSEIPYRIILISFAHLMSIEAQNALLKQLEEPPAGTVFILCTSNPTQLMETIRSRCWELIFLPLSIEEIKEILKSKFGIEKELADKIAIFSNGSVTEALNLFENNFNEMFEDTIQILRYSFAKKYNSAYKVLTKYTSVNNSTSFKLLLKMIIIWLNDLIKEKNNLTNIYFVKHKSTLEKFNSKFPSLKVAPLVEKIDHLSNLIDRNINKSIIVLNLVNELAAFIR